MCINGNYSHTIRKPITAYRMWGVAMIYKNGRLVDARLRGTYMKGSVWLNKTKTAPRVGECTNSDLGLHSYANKSRCKGHGDVWGKVKLSGKTAVFTQSDANTTTCKVCRNVVRVNRPTGYLSKHIEIVSIHVPRGYYGVETKKLVPLLRKRYKVPVTLGR